VIDFSEDMARMAGSKTIELPWVSPPTDLYPVYVHFGSEARLALSGQNRTIEGAYLEIGNAPGIVLIRYICNEVRRGGSLGDALVAQSEVIGARLDMGSDDLIDIYGDPSLVSASPTMEMASRTVFAIAHILGPSADPASLPSKLPRSLN